MRPTRAPLLIAFALLVVSGLSNPTQPAAADLFISTLGFPGEGPTGDGEDAECAGMQVAIPSPFKCHPDSAHMCTPTQMTRAARDRSDWKNTDGYYCYSRCDEKCSGRMVFGCAHCDEIYTERSNLKRHYENCPLNNTTDYYDPNTTMDVEDDGPFCCITEQMRHATVCAVHTLEAANKICEIAGNRCTRCPSTKLRTLYHEIETSLEIIQVSTEDAQQACDTGNGEVLDAEIRVVNEEYAKLNKSNEAMTAELITMQHSVERDGESPFRQPYTILPRDDLNTHGILHNPYLRDFRTMDEWNGTAAYRDFCYAGGGKEGVRAAFAKALPGCVFKNDLSDNALKVQQQILGLSRSLTLENQGMLAELLTEVKNATKRGEELFLPGSKANMRKWYGREGANSVLSNARFWNITPVGDAAIANPLELAGLCVAMGTCGEQIYDAGEDANLDASCPSLTGAGREAAEKAGAGKWGEDDYCFSQYAVQGVSTWSDGASVRQVRIRFDSIVLTCVHRPPPSPRTVCQVALSHQWEHTREILDVR